MGAAQQATHLTRFRTTGPQRLGIDRGDRIVDLTAGYAHALRARGVADADAVAALALPPDALAYFDGGAASRDLVTEVLEHVDGIDPADALADGLTVDAAQATTLVPIPNPRKIVCVARNFGKHAAEAGLEVSQIPILFPRFAATLIADGDPIEVPPVSHQVDWEGELAVVIGRGGRYIGRDEAMSHVAGYTIFNDVSVRDYQFRVSQYTGGKNFATSGPIGPSIRLVDDEFDPHDARIRTSINGVVKQDASTQEFIFDIPEIIEHISEFVPLEPGDVIPMGTPAGVGFKRTPPEFLTPGDVIEVAVDGLGVLRNPVVAGTRPA